MWAMWQWLLYLSKSKTAHQKLIPTSSYAIAHSSEASQDQSPFSVHVLDAGLELQLNSELQQYS